MLTWSPPPMRSSSRAATRIAATPAYEGGGKTPLRSSRISRRSSTKYETSETGHSCTAAFAVMAQEAALRSSGPCGLRSNGAIRRKCGGAPTRLRRKPCKPRDSRDSALAPAHLAIAKARHDVVVHEPGGLHERVTDGRSHEAKSASLQILAHRARLRCLRRHLPEGAPPVPFRPAFDEAPEVGIQGSVFFSHRQRRARVRDRRVDLQAVPHDPRITEQALALSLVESRDLLRVEGGKGLPIALALAEDRRPREPGLGALEDEHLEEVPVVVGRGAPFLIVVSEVQRVVL